MMAPTETRKPDSQFVVRVSNLKNRKSEVHYFERKAQAETFRSSCKPPDYMKPVVYPIALHDKIS